MRSLRDGDRLRLGAYEIEVRLVEEAVRQRSGAGSSPFADPFAMDPFGPARPERNPFDEPDHPSLRIPPTSAQLPHDFDPLAPEPREAPFRGPTQADNSPVGQDAFHLPAQIGQMPLHTGGVIPGDDLLPDDWDKDLLEGIAPAGARRAAPPHPHRRRLARLPARRRRSPSRRSTNRQRPRRRRRPWPPRARCARRRGSRKSSPTMARCWRRSSKAPACRTRAPMIRRRPCSRLGKAFRNMVAGLRAVLIARAQIKGEFRIEQTMIQAHGNNPLKFSAGDDDAMAALLGAGRRTDMAPHEAVADALRDIRLHELASMAAMQSAVRAVLDGLDPAKLRAQAEQGGAMSLLPAQKKARAWDAYEALHARTVQALADDFDSVFGKAFARAYERSLHEVAAKERE